MNLEIGTYILLTPSDWYSIVGKVIGHTKVGKKNPIVEYEIKRYGKYETITGVFSKGYYKEVSEEKLKEYIRNKNLRNLL